MKTSINTFHLSAVIGTLLLSATVVFPADPISSGILVPGVEWELVDIRIDRGRSSSEVVRVDKTQNDTDQSRWEEGGKVSQGNTRAAERSHSVGNSETEIAESGWNVGATGNARAGFGFRTIVPHASVDFELSATGSYSKGRRNAARNEESWKDSNSETGSQTASDYSTRERGKTISSSTTDSRTETEMLGNSALVFSIRFKNCDPNQIYTFNRGGNDATPEVSLRLPDGYEISVPVEEQTFTLYPFLPFSLHFRHVIDSESDWLYIRKAIHSGTFDKNRCIIELNPSRFPLRNTEGDNVLFISEGIKKFGFPAAIRLEVSEFRELSPWKAKPIVNATGMSLRDALSAINGQVRSTGQFLNVPFEFGPSADTNSQETVLIGINDDDRTLLFDTLVKGLDAENNAIPIVLYLECKTDRKQECLTSVSADILDAKLKKGSVFTFAARDLDNLGKSFVQDVAVQVSPSERQALVHLLEREVPLLETNSVLYVPALVAGAKLQAIDSMSPTNASLVIRLERFANETGDRKLAECLFDVFSSGKSVSAETIAYWRDKAGLPIEEPKQSAEEQPPTEVESAVSSLTESSTQKINRESMVSESQESTGETSSADFPEEDELSETEYMALTGSTAIERENAINALSILESQPVIAYAALNDPFGRVRYAAIRKIVGQDILIEVVRQETEGWIAAEAIGNLFDKSTLWWCMKNHPSPIARNAAEKQLNRIDLFR